MIGEGQPYLALFVIIFIQGSTYEFNYFLITFLQTLYISHILKMVHHAPRPYFDDPSIADNDLKDCAGEFGNPSAHSQMAATVILTLSVYY